MSPKELGPLALPTMFLGCLQLKASKLMLLRKRTGNAVQGRSAKMSEILGRLQSIPTASRPENVTMCTAFRVAGFLFVWDFFSMNLSLL